MLDSRNSRNTGGRIVISLDIKFPMKKIKLFSYLLGLLIVLLGFNSMAQVNWGPFMNDSSDIVIISEYGLSDRISNDVAGWYDLDINLGFNYNVTNHFSIGGIGNVRWENFSGGAIGIGPRFSYYPNRSFELNATPLLHSSNYFQLELSANWKHYLGLFTKFGFDPIAKNPNKFVLTNIGVKSGGAGCIFGPILTGFAFLILLGINGGFNIG
jgi:hypothetical protein